MNNEETLQPWWKLHPLAWLGIVLLVLINVAVFTDWIPFDRQIASWIVYSFDPHTWPLWMSALLWCAVVWKIGDLDACPKALRQIAKPASILFFLFAVGYQNDWHLTTQRSRWYGRIYVPYIMGPLSRFINDGYWDWKTFILPSIVLVATGGLVLLVRKTSRMKTEEKEKRSEQLRGQIVWFVVLVVIAVLLVQCFAWIPATWKVDLGHHADHFYQQHIITPMASFLSSDYRDWKIFILPALGLSALGTLVFLAIRLRKKNREKKTNEK